MAHSRTSTSRVVGSRCVVGEGAMDTCNLPAIFELARALSGNPQQVWMVGDNQQADVDGAHAVGIPAILVQHPDRPLAPGALSLLEVEGTICE